MKTKGLRTFLASVAALALVGTGYAAWQFTSGDSSVATGTVAVTEVIKSGDLKIDADKDGTFNNDETFYLVIDQNFLGWSSVKPAADTSATDYDWKAITTIDVKFTGSEDTSVAETINFSDEVVNNLSAYITIGEHGTYTADSLTNTGSELVNTYTLPTVDWKEGMKPTTNAEYETMKADIGAKKVVITLSADVAA